ncbi:unnamed protein product [Schistosoma guineensis]|nr:unnamed protein product [Schistosoma guineensis]
MIIKAIVLLCLTQYLMCEVAMMSTPASSNIASDKVSEVEDMVTDDGEDSKSDDNDENFFDKLIMVIVMSFEYLFPDLMKTTPSFNTTMGV